MKLIIKTKKKYFSKSKESRPKMNITCKDCKGQSKIFQEDFRDFPMYIFRILSLECMILFHYVFAKKINIYKLYKTKFKSKYRKNNKWIKLLNGKILMVFFRKIKIAGIILTQEHIKMNQKTKQTSYK